VVEFNATLLEAFFKDLRESISDWTSFAERAALGDPEIPESIASFPEWQVLRGSLNTEELRMAFTEIVRYLLEGITFSILVTIDGGSAMSNVERVFLVDNQGKELAPALHEEFDPSDS